MQFHVILLISHLNRSERLLSHTVTSASPIANLKTLLLVSPHFSGHYDSEEPFLRVV